MEVAGAGLGKHAVPDQHCVARTHGLRLLHKVDTIAALVDEARWMVEQGCKVITLLGQTVNSYGEDLEPDGGSGRRGRPSLADLIRALQELDGLERIRLITLAPAYVNQALAEAIRDCDKAERFLPLPAG